MKSNLKIIYSLFNGKLVGNKKMKLYVCKTVALLPEEVIKFVTTKCWFFGSMEDAWAFTFTGNDLKNQHLIFLSDALLYKNDFQIKYTILHEIGHVILKHRNSVLEKQSPKEIRQQEKAADEFANKYL